MGIIKDFILFMQYDAVRIPRKIRLKLKKENRELSRLNIGDEHFGYDERFEDLSGVQGGVGKKLDVQKMYKDEGDSEDLNYKPEVKAHEVVGYVVLDGKKRVVYRDYY